MDCKDIQSALNHKIYSIHFSSSTEGWAVGTIYMDGFVVLLRYKDGIWTNEPPPAVPGSPEGLGSVYMISPDEGWAGGINLFSDLGVLLHYQSGTWTYEPPPIAEHSWIGSVHFNSPDSGWAVGFTIWKYDPFEIFSSFFGTTASPNVIFIYNSGNWSVFPDMYVHPNRVDWALGEVFCPDEDNCWFVGEGDGDGLIMKY